MKTLKKLLVFAGILALIAIVILVYLVIKIKLEEKSNIANMYRNVGKPIPAAQKPTDEDTYKNNQYHFSFTFGNLKQFQKLDDYKITIPEGKNGMDLDAIVTYQHIIEEQYCSPKGDCIPYTNDMTFGVGVYNTNIDEYAKRNPQIVKAPITEKRYAYSYNEGAEGEGINYYFIAMNPGRIAIIFHKYIDESVNPKYQKSMNFIPYATQQKRLDSMITSFSSTNN